MTAANTLDVVLELFNSLKEAISGAPQVFFGGCQSLIILVGIDGKASTAGIRQALGMSKLLETSNSIETNGAC